MVQERLASAEGGMLPQKIFKSESLINCHFLHSQADSCVNKVPKINRYFLLNFDKKSVVISCNIFS